jgi:hypothetical protein
MKIEKKAHKKITERQMLHNESSQQSLPWHRRETGPLGGVGRVVVVKHNKEIIMHLSGRRSEMESQDKNVDTRFSAERFAAFIQLCSGLLTAVQVLIAM